MRAPSQWLGPELLAHGPFGVGFRSVWEMDEGRTYRTEFDDGKTYGAEKSPRPVLVLHWYPTRDRRADTMAHRQYFAINGDPRVRDLADAMAAYARDIFAYYVMGKPEDELGEVERAEMAEALSEPTRCVEGAEPADRAFPLIVYHGGAGSSYEDNAALCAYLASHGFVVLGSPFPDAHGESFNIDGFDGSAGDVEFLIDWARATSSADVRRVGLIGHSAGAQALSRIAGRPESPCNALVLLDTTQDYFSLTVPFFTPLVREITDCVSTLTAPMLVVAGPAAIFALCDELVNAERIYLTVPGLGHDDFISQGQQGFARIARSARASPADAEAAAVAHGLYGVMCERVLQFFAATLRDDPEAAACLAETDPWSPATPSVVRVPRGATSPEPYDPSSEIPPTPRQFVRMLATPGIEQACLVLERAKASAPDSPICTDTRLAGSMLCDLIDAGRDDDATRYQESLTAMGLDVVSWFVDQADFPDRDIALHFLNLAHRLDPENADIAAQLGSAD
jgi:pimeloyl-ACP methyl ester carboxylesterase